MVTRMARRNPKGEIIRWYRGVITDIENATADQLHESMETGAEWTREFVQTRATAWGRSQGRQGRVVTGEMLRGIGSTITRSSGGKRQGRFGWLQRTPFYAIYQEGGFINVRTGRAVEGMYALSDAADLVFRQFREGLTRRLRRK